jgi:hypothetical protein
MPYDMMVTMTKGRTMAHMPNQVTVHITQGELAQQLEELALQYEEVVQTLRWQAENLRSGFDLTLDIRATQVSQPVRNFDPPPNEEDEAEAFAEPKTKAQNDALIRLRREAEAQRNRLAREQGTPSIFDAFEPKVGLKSTPEKSVNKLPQEAIDLIDSMTNTSNKGEEE